MYHNIKIKKKDLLRCIQFINKNHHQISENCLQHAVTFVTLYVMSKRETINYDLYGQMGQSCWCSYQYCTLT